MHVCLIFGEAGSSHSKAWFESEKMLQKLYSHGSTLASSVSVVVAGTGITKLALSSSKDCFVF